MKKKLKAIKDKLKIDNFKNRIYLIKLNYCYELKLMKNAIADHQAQQKLKRATKIERNR